MRPSKKLLDLVVAFGVLAFLPLLARSYLSDDVARIGAPSGFAEVLSGLWWTALVIAGAVVIWDAICAFKGLDITVNRDLPRSMALGVFTNVRLNVVNNSARDLHVLLAEAIPGNTSAKAMPLDFTIAANAKKTLSYGLLPEQRGEAAFGKTWLRIASPLGFWLKSQTIRHADNANSVKIYPNFAPIAHSAAISLDHHIAQMGIHLQQRRGEGSDFHQLREFREGDSLRQIDWNATSRRYKPISREYQDERDQDVIFLLDCGRRLRTKEDGISLFDHALNAFLLTSYVALRQGDAVGFLSFGGDHRWMPPIKHPKNINTLLNQLYDLHSQTDASDFIDAAQQLLSRRKKRALVILLTCAREDDVDELTTAVRLLSSKHMVMVASLRDGFFDQRLAEPVESFSEALSYAATFDYYKRRLQVLAQLRARGTVVTDALPAQLHLLLVQEYLKLKRSGKF
ncbi:MAG TPA: DUF58 domain-containing protein [Marinagarivorans sp.]